MKRFFVFSLVVFCAFFAYVRLDSEGPPEEVSPDGTKLYRIDALPTSVTATPVASTPAPETKEAPEPAPETLPVQTTPATPDCAILGPFTPKQLTAANKVIRRAGLIDKVLLEDILGPDEYVVFIIPTTTFKGAQALVKQVRARGYHHAIAIPDGPLQNATRLNVFKDEASAAAFLEKARKDLHMDAIRMSRMMGLATGNVNMVFRNLTETDRPRLEKAASSLGKKVLSCEAN